MSQNKSSAVMNQRKEPKDSLDFFPTPLWATRAFCEHVLPQACIDPHIWAAHVWDPACGEGHMARALADYFQLVSSTDVFDYGVGAEVEDFLFPGAAPVDADWVITNPPFRLAPEFVARALDVSKHGCAFLVRTNFVEGVGRFLNLFSPMPPVIIAQFSERVTMVKGHVDEEASGATAYAWFVWLKNYQGPTRMIWIPPCRKSLEKIGDWE